MNRYPNCIRTFSGHYIDPFDPDPELICIEDIAHSLSLQCRFGGNLPCFYSVAQHSWKVGANIKCGLNLEGLLHDASEAYLLDIPRPWKHRLNGYKEMEDKLMAIITDKFKIQYPLHRAVKTLDDYEGRFEWENYMINNRGHLMDVWSSQLAEVNFLKLYHQYKRS